MPCARVTSYGATLHEYSAPSAITRSPLRLLRVPAAVEREDADAAVVAARDDPLVVEAHRAHKVAVRGDAEEQRRLGRAALALALRSASQRPPRQRRRLPLPRRPPHAVGVGVGVDGVGSVRLVEAREERRELPRADRSVHRSGAGAGGTARHRRVCARSCPNSSPVRTQIVPSATTRLPAPPALRRRQRARRPRDGEPGHHRECAAAWRQLCESRPYTRTVRSRDALHRRRRRRRRRRRQRAEGRSPSRCRGAPPAELDLGRRGRRGGGDTALGGGGGGGRSRPPRAGGSSATRRTAPSHRRRREVAVEDALECRRRPEARAAPAAGPRGGAAPSAGGRRRSACQTMRATLPPPPGRRRHRLRRRRGRRRGRRWRRWRPAPQPARRRRRRRRRAALVVEVPDRQPPPSSVVAGTWAACRAGAEDAARVQAGGGARRPCASHSRSAPRCSRESHESAQGGRRRRASRSCTEESRRRSASSAWARVSVDAPELERRRVERGEHEVAVVERDARHLARALVRAAASSGSAAAPTRAPPRLDHRLLPHCEAGPISEESFGVGAACADICRPRRREADAPQMSSEYASGGAACSREHRRSQRRQQRDGERELRRQQPGSPLRVLGHGLARRDAVCVFACMCRAQQPPAADRGSMSGCRRGRSGAQLAELALREAREPRGGRGGGGRRLFWPVILCGSCRREV